MVSVDETRGKVFVVEIRTRKNDVNGNPVPCVSYSSVLNALNKELKGAESISIVNEWETI